MSKEAANDFPYGEELMAREQARSLVRRSEVVYWAAKSLKINGCNTTRTRERARCMLDETLCPVHACFVRPPA
jgi:hypothetical protein